MRIHPHKAMLAALIVLAPATAGSRTVRTAHFVISHPDRESAGGLAEALEAAYGTVRSAGLKLPAQIAVRVHATTTEFAARSGAGRMHLAGVRGATLHLQPIGVLLRQPGLDRALAHELVHVALAPAAQRMPRWLSEGVAMTVAGERHPAEGRFASAAELDRALETARTHQEARRAYAVAGRLARRLGERIGSGRMLAALRSILGGRETAAAFRDVAGLELDRWVAAELADAKAAQKRAPR